MAEKLEFSQEVRREFDAIVERYPEKRAALLPVLHVIQRELGYIPAEAEEYVAHLLEVPVVKVHEVTTFYTMLHLEPVGRHHLQFCRTLSCALRGGEELLQAACKRLKIAEGEVSEDGCFSIEGVECLGVCGNAPALQVNEDFQLDLTAERLEKLLDELDKS